MEFIKLNFKSCGICEWLIVRLSAILIMLYFIYLCNFIYINNNLSYEEWYDFFCSKRIKVFNTIILVSILKHTWIGIRHILEDYIQSIKLRKLGIKFICITLYVYLLFGMIIIWSA